MSDKTKEKAAEFVVFAIVDREGEVPYRQGVFAVQEQQHLVGARVVNEKSFIVTPNDAGLYIIPPGHEFAEQSIDALKAKQVRENREGQTPRIIGPFAGENLSTVTETALKAVVKTRPLTDGEAAAKYKAKLEQSETEHSAEVEAAKQRIAELEAALKAKESGAKK